MKIQAIRGMQDLLPAQQEIYSHVLSVVAGVLNQYGYDQIGMPLLESTGLFKRLVGEATDVVEKEMYTFDDRSGDSITLRPEGTAGCVRLAQQHGLTYNQIQRFWYAGPMFRYERPQKGRYRQFEQIGAECFGMAGPDIDAELLLMTARMWNELGITSDVTLELNSLGSNEARKAYRDKLVAFLQQHQDALDEDSRRRLSTNPLRILDSKVPSTQALVADAPLLLENLDEESQVHFDALRRTLDKRQIPYVVNPRIVRGLDYYNRTVFEWTTNALGAQGTVCGGGRYDGLVEQVGGKPTPGIGFAMGVDRLALMLEAQFKHRAGADVYLVSQGDEARLSALVLAEQIRSELNGLRVVVHCGDGKFKAQLKKADASQAQVALIIGEAEAEQDQVGFKLLREGSEQLTLPGSKIVAELKKVFA